VFLGSKWFKTLVTCGVVFRLENMFENDFKSVKARNKTCAWVWFWFWKWKPNNLHSKQPTCFRICIALLWKRLSGTNTMRMWCVAWKVVLGENWIKQVLLLMSWRKPILSWCGSLATRWWLSDRWSPEFALGVEVLTCHRQVVAQRPLATPGSGFNFLIPFY
jgi:hypothetical protein